MVRIKLNNVGRHSLKQEKANSVLVSVSEKLGKSKNVPGSVIGTYYEKIDFARLFRNIKQDIRHVLGKTEQVPTPADQAPDFLLKEGVCVLEEQQQTNDELISMFLLWKTLIGLEDLESHQVLLAIDELDMVVSVNNSCPVYTGEVRVQFRDQVPLNERAVNNRQELFIDEVESNENLY